MAASIRIGILEDMADGPPGFARRRWLDFAIDELRVAGRIDRPVEFVSAYGVGLPSGTAAGVEKAYRELVEQDVLLIAGPSIGDNALIATPLADRHRVPTLNWAGSEHARGEWMFHQQVGSHEDESILLARHVAHLGLRRIGVVHDRSPIGRRHLAFLQDEADVLGLSIASVVSLSPIAETATAEVREVLASRPDAMVYLGLGLAAPAVATALTDGGWKGARVMNTAGIRGYQPGFAAAIDGWIYVDMHSDDNRTLADLRRRTDTPLEGAYGAAQGYDLGRLIAEAVARAPSLTRAGLREGLERIKWLPAAEGEEGTLLGFGTFDRGALHGRYLVLRQWREGRSIQV